MAGTSNVNMIEENTLVGSPEYIPVENPRMYQTARMRVGTIDTNEEPMEFHPYHPVINLDDISDNDDLDETQHDEEILDAVEAEEGSVGGNEDQPMELEFLLGAIQYAMNEINVVHGEAELYKARWITEMEKNQQLQVSLAIKEAEKIQLEDKMLKEKEDRCRSYWELNRDIEDFPVARGESGYEINRSVVSSMLFKEFKKVKYS